MSRASGNVLVLGAGAVGLSTALFLKDECPDADVTVLAEGFQQDTTSDGAAGMFRPSQFLTPSKSEELMRIRLQTSFDWFDALWRELDPRDTGIIRVNGYQMMTKQIPMPVSKSMLYSMEELNENQIRRLPGYGTHQYTHAWFVDTLMIECRRYLPWLTKRFLSRGGKIVGKALNKLEDIPGGYDVIVNCLGLGSRTVFGDTSVFPVRGHTLRVEAPFIKQFYVLEDGDNYIYPGQDNVLLGGTREANEFRLDYDQRKYDVIKQKCCSILPPLQNVPVVKQWVGLRPHRPEIRIEPEVININGKMEQVVHNYGHGANGVCLSWGTAVEATTLVLQALSRSRSSRQQPLVTSQFSTVHTNSGTGSSKGSKNLDKSVMNIEKKSGHLSKL